MTQGSKVVPEKPTMFSASEDNARLLWTTKVQGRIYKIRQYTINTCYFLNDHLTITLIPRLPADLFPTKVLNTFLISQMRATFFIQLIPLQVTG